MCSFVDILELLDAHLRVNLLLNALGADRASRTETPKSKRGWALPKVSKGNQVQPLNTGKVGVSCQQSATVLHGHGSDPDVV